MTTAEARNIIRWVLTTPGLYEKAENALGLALRVVPPVMATAGSYLLSEWIGGKVEGGQKQAALRRSIIKRAREIKGR